MGNKQELLVTVKQPGGREGATDVTMITDVAANVVLHWGVKKGQSGEWLLPEKDLWPQGSKVHLLAFPTYCWTVHRMSLKLLGDCAQDSELSGSLLHPLILLCCAMHACSSESDQPHLYQQLHDDKGPLLLEILRLAGALACQRHGALFVSHWKVVNTQSCS